MENIEAKAPHLAKVIECITQKNIFQKKAIAVMLKNADEEFLRFADGVVRRLSQSALRKKDDYSYLADAYVNYTKMIRAEELYYAKKGRYRQSDYDTVYKEVYGRDDYMMDYAAGLGMTQVFWPNHYAIVRFFIDHFVPQVKAFESGAEVGVGHGLFHAELLRGAPRMRTTMLDVSKSSLQTTLNMITATGLDASRANPVQVDVQKEIPLQDQSLDALLMGELIEHIQYGAEVMNAFARKMKPTGYCFFSTAANAPAEDHILLFKSTAEIRKFITDNGWQIEKEHIGTLRGMDITEAENGGHNINYASILRIKA
jgi:SAM-dependent methyltransferase